LLVVADENRSDRLGQSPLADIATRKTSRLLNIARCSGGNSSVTEHQLFGNTTAIHADEHCLELLASDRETIILRQSKGETHRPPTGNDRNLVQGIIALRLDRAYRMSTFVVGGQRPLLLTHHHGFSFGAEHYLVLGVFEIDHVDL